jgi:hypothetical protein
MARICEYYYLIERQNGIESTLKREEFSNCIEEYYDDFLTNEIYTIKKVYKLKNVKKRIYMTLFTIEQSFSPEEYIEHYEGIEGEIYGVKILNDFDVIIINKFN